LPDGIFSNQKSQFGQILEGFGKERVGIFFGHIKNTMDIWYILLLFGNLVAIWYIFRFGILCQEKSGNPGQQQIFCATNRLETQLQGIGFSWSRFSG
jgi:hypothetical protein